MREDLILTIILVLVVPVMAFMIYKFVGISYEFYIRKKIYLPVDEKDPGAAVEMVDESKTYIHQLAKHKHKHKYVLNGEESPSPFRHHEGFLYFECACSDVRVFSRTHWRKMWTNSQD